jgi:hypothetical protein
MCRKSFNIRTIFTTEHTLMGSLMSTRPEGNLQQRAHCICSIPCETGIPLAMQLHNLRESLLPKLKVVQPACEEGHMVGWDEAKILELESNSRPRKYK